VSAYDRHCVELVCELRKSHRSAYLLRDYLLSQPGIGSVVVELLPYSYGGTQ
jgi:hypothetical protein